MKPEFTSKLYFWFVIIFCIGVAFFVYQKISYAIVEIDGISKSILETRNITKIIEK